MQIKSNDGRVRLKLGVHHATLYMDGKKATTFEIRSVPELTMAEAKGLGRDSDTTTLVRYERSSPEGRTMLRRLGISFVGNDGEVYLHAPPIHVELPGRRDLPDALPTARPAPFAPKASRISRWLLIHPGSEPSFRDLATAVELSESMVSRTLAALAADRLVEVAIDRKDARARRVQIPDARALLNAFESATQRKPRGSTWDIGARELKVTLQRVRMASKRGSLAYALGGLAGASLYHPVVEPTEVDIWVGRDDYALWLDQLTPIKARRGPGRLTVNVLPDPYVLTLTKRKQGLLVADPVQLYFDCHRSGERSLEAAQAIREEMGW